MCMSQKFTDLKQVVSFGQFYLRLWGGSFRPQYELVDSSKETLCVLKIGKRLYKHVALIQDL